LLEIFNLTAYLSSFGEAPFSSQTETKTQPITKLYSPTLWERV